MGSDQAAVALLKSEQIRSLSGLLKLQDLLSDILEAGQHLDQLYAVIVRDGIRQIGGHDRLDQGSVLGKAALQGLFLSDLIISQQAA